SRQQGEGVSIGPQSLRRRLKDKGLLVTTDAARGKLTVRRTLQGARRDVLHIAWPVAPSPPANGPIGPEDEADGENGPEPWAGPWPRKGGSNGDPAPPTAAAGTPGNSLATVGPELGRLGRSDTGEEGAAGVNNHEQRSAGPRPPARTRLYYRD